MAESALCSIAQLCDAGIAELQTGPFGTQLHAHDYVADGVPVVPTEALRERQINSNVLPKISAGKAEELSRHRLKPGDILFARRGVQATGHIGYVRAAEAGFICGTGAIRLRLAEKNDAVSAEFLSHLLANPTSIQWFKFHAIGATMPNLNEGIIRAFTFSLPPIDDQKAIAELLSALDDKIEVNRRLNETLESAASAFFKDWFVDFGPTRAKAEGIKPYLCSDVWSLFPDALDAGRPREWRESAVGDIAVLAKATVAPSASPDEIFSHYSIPAYDSGQLAIEQRGADILSNKLEIPHDAILLSKLNPEIPRVWLTPAAGTNRQICSTEFLPFRAKSEVGRGFMYALFLARHFRELLQGMVTGTSKSHQRVTPQSVLDVRIVLPNKNSKLPNAFEEVVGPLLSRVLQNRAERRDLIELRDLLLPRLMSGKLRLKDAEKQVSEVA